MRNTSALRAVLAVTAAAVTPAPLSGQTPAVALARPGNGIVSGPVRPSRFRFGGSSACGGENLSLVAVEIALRGDSELLFVQVLQFIDQPRALVDTAVLNRRTLAPIWGRRYLGPDTAASWAVRGSRVSGFTQQPGERRRSYDSELREPAFPDVTIHLLLQATSGLSVPASKITFATFGFEEDAAKPPAVVQYADTARVIGSETVRLANGKRLETWVVAVGNPPDLVDYWVEKSTHEVAGWFVPSQECATKYLRIAP